MKISDIIVENLRVDVPNEEWLQDAIDYAKSHSPDRRGLPYMGKTTATVRKVEVPVNLLKRIPGMRNEQQNVRQGDLAAIMKIMSDTGKLPIHAHSNEEYKPFINVAYDGSAWVNEGNHRIMAAYRLGWDSLPIEISYFDGGERVESGPMYPGKIGLGAVDEGWKDTLATAAIAGGIALGGGAGLSAKDAYQKWLNKDQPATSQMAAPAAPTTFAQAKSEPVVATPAPVKNAAVKKLDVKAITGRPLETVLLKTAKASGLAGAELAAFLAQCAHETLDFKALKEFGGSLDFRKYDPKYAPKKAKILGNTKIGDGAKYKGRGFIQLTGRDNYKKAGNELGLPLEKHPEMVEDPKIAAQVAVWFWKHRVQPNVDNFNDVNAVTKMINPGMRGLEDRTDNFKNYMQVAMR
jgi:putative chitinase